MLHPLLEDAIETLLACWRHYDDAKRRSADYAMLSAARHRLDLERSRVYRLRRGLHPEARELEEVAASFTCPSLGVPVFVYPRKDGGVLCPCGAPVATVEREHA